MKAKIFTATLFIVFQLSAQYANACCGYWNRTNTYGFRVENEYFLTSTSLPIGKWLINYYPYDEIQLDEYDKENLTRYKELKESLKDNVQKLLFKDEFFLRAYNKEKFPDLFYAYMPNENDPEYIRTSINYEIQKVFVTKEDNELRIGLNGINRYLSRDFQIRVISTTKEGFTNFHEFTIGEVKKEIESEDSYYTYTETSYNLNTIVPINKNTDKVELCIFNRDAKLIYSRPLLDHKKEFKIYPTQVEQNFTLESPVKEGIVCLYNLNGTPLTPIPFNGFNNVINIQNLNRGIYIMRIINNNALLHTQKIVKL